MTFFDFRYVNLPPRLKKKECLIETFLESFKLLFRITEFLLRHRPQEFQVPVEFPSEDPAQVSVSVPVSFPVSTVKCSLPSISMS